ncbi:hypothetical protein EYF80_021175 [Liparis tanakae]|uniref:Uncharacterized protein n=1 Tax=Liparis tanakae TaxID=230148 RepID=A0A4Z2HRR3_9TELE|nr:hypothetical protein EYF80_021175 [Liparis tanakae]
MAQTTKVCKTTPSQSHDVLAVCPSGTYKQNCYVPVVSMYAWSMLEKACLKHMKERFFSFNQEPESNAKMKQRGSCCNHPPTPTHPQVGNKRMKVKTENNCMARLLATAAFHET